MRIWNIFSYGKHKKTRIFKLEQEDGVIYGDANLKKYITKYYKNLFGPPDITRVKMDESWKDDIRQVSDQENELLIQNFTEAEVKETALQMKHNTILGPESFPPEFDMAWSVRSVQGKVEE
jgi:hypothetical protein